MEIDGRVRWEVTVDGPIHALAAGGDRGMAVVSWERRDGRGILSWFSGLDGTPTHQDETPGPAPVVTVSANGSLLAVVLPDEAHFYTVGSSLD
jgi:hypothetical protein